MTLPVGFGVALDAGSWLDGDVLFGGAPFRIVRLSPDQRATIAAWQDGALVAGQDDGMLARGLVDAGLAQPLPPALLPALSPAASPSAPPPASPSISPPVSSPASPSTSTAGQPRVSVVIPVRDRPTQLTRLLAAVRAHASSDDPVHEVIVVDDASADAGAHAAAAADTGARLIRRPTQGRAPTARNDGAAVATGDVLAFVDSDVVPTPGWLSTLLPHFADPQVAAVAPRVVALDDGRHGWLDRYEGHRAPYDRGPLPSLVVPGARVPFVPAATVLVRASQFPGFDASLRGGEDVDLVWRLGEAGLHVRYEPAAEVAHEHRTTPRAFVGRRAYYGRTAAPLARRHPGAAPPLVTSPWTGAAWAALALRRPVMAAGITGTACALLARQLHDVVDDPMRTAAQLAGGGTIRAGGAVADAVVRSWWPVSLLAAASVPRLRPALAAAAIAPGMLEWHRQRPGLDPLRWLLARRLDDTAYGWGIWSGVLAGREPGPLCPGLGWRLRIESADDLITVVREAAALREDAPAARETPSGHSPAAD